MKQVVDAQNAHAFFNFVAYYEINLDNYHGICSSHRNFLMKFAYIDRRGFHIKPFIGNCEVDLIIERLLELERTLP